jgi:hypothetical protein
MCKTCGCNLTNKKAAGYGKGPKKGSKKKKK